MPYFEATILEVLRRADIAPLSVQHGLASDVMFQDYVIPRDAIVLPDLGSALSDPEVWGDPENFRPERFIGPEGKVKQTDEFVPFSLGKFECVYSSRGMKPSVSDWLYSFIFTFFPLYFSTIVSEA